MELVFFFFFFAAEITNGMPLFPGESDIDQLFHIVRCFGTLTDRQMELFRTNPLFGQCDDFWICVATINYCSYCPDIIFSTIFI